jgi:hypothetical protein
VIPRHCGRRLAAAYEDSIQPTGGRRDPVALPPQVPDTIRQLLADPDVQTVLNYADGGPLTPELIVACRGG